MRIGTSGYAYRHWRGVLYPPGLPASRWLSRYAEVFGSVELNTTFYRLPTRAAAARWAGEAPEGFVFVAKGSRYLTHLKRLLDTERGIDRYFDALAPLGARLEAVLWQLPPRMKADRPRLEAFLDALAGRAPRGVRHAFEFRDPDWYDAAVGALLAERGAAFCEHDLVAVARPRAAYPFRYLRFHGAGARYAGRYGRAALERTALALRRARAAGETAYAFFNNDLGGAAVHDALSLIDLVGEEAGGGAREPDRPIPPP